MTYAFQFMTPKQKEELSMIRIHYDTSQAILRLKCFKDYLKIEYQQDGNDTLIVCDDPKKEISVKKIDFMTIFLEDIKTILKEQKATLYYFQCRHNQYMRQRDPVATQIFEVLLDALSSRNQKLQVKSTQMDGNVEQLMSIVSHFDANMLRRVVLIFNERTLNIKDVLTMDYWKHTELSYLNLSHIITANNLLSIKETMLYSPIAKEFEIIGHDNEKILEEAFGESKQDEKRPRCKIWSFSIPNTEGYILEIVLELRPMSPRINFVRKKMGDKDEATFPKISMKGATETNETRSLSEEVSSKVFRNNLIMVNIMQHLQCFDILRLRKVSTDIRSSIDRIKPEARIEKIDITCDVERCYVSLSLKENSAIGINYKNNHSGCFVEWFDHKNYINEDFLSIMLKDFDICSRHQKSCLQELRLAFVNCRTEKYKFFVLRTLQEMLKSREHPLRVENLHLLLVEQKEILKILPHIDPASLKSIEILSCDHPRILEINEISKLEQWIKTTELVIDKHIISTPIQQMNIINFAKVDIVVSTLSSEDLFYLKKELLKSSTLIKFKINFKSRTVDDTIHDLMETPPQQRTPISTSQKMTWYFVISNDEVLFILFHVTKAVIFSRIEMSKVPGGAVVQF